MSLTVVGSFMYDLMADAPRQPQPGETLRGTAFRRSVGGKGFNQAVAAARAGAEVAMVGKLGEDPFGDEFRAALNAEGIDDHHVSVSTVEGSGTGIGLPVVFPDGNNSIIIIPRANLEIAAQDIDDASDAIDGASVVLLQLEIPIDMVVRTAERAHAHGAKVVLNPAPYHAVPEEIWQHIDLFIPNEGELAAYCAEYGIEAADVTESARAFAERFDVDVIVTLGNKGSQAIPAPGSTMPEAVVPGISVTAVDAVGAGDTYCGALCAELDAGRDITEAMRFANAAAALSVTRPGSGTSAPTRSETTSLLSDNGTD